MACLSCFGCKRAEVVMDRLDHNEMDKVIEDVVIPYFGRELFAFENETT